MNRSWRNGRRESESMYYGVGGIVTIILILVLLKLLGLF